MTTRRGAGSGRGRGAGLRRGGGRRGVLLVGQAQPADGLVVHVARSGQGQPDGGGAEVPGGQQAAAGRAAGLVQPEAEVHPAPGRGLDHGEDPARRGQRDQGPPGLHGDRPDLGQHGQHGVQDGPQLRPVGVLAVDEPEGLRR